MKKFWDKSRPDLSASMRKRLHWGIDLTLGGLMLLGALAHAYGSAMAYPAGSEVLVWSLAAGGFGLLLAALNLLRANRPHDRTLAWICAGGCVLWALTAAAFGMAIQHIFDARVIFHVVVAAALADLSIRMALGKDEVAAPRPEAETASSAASSDGLAPQSVDVPPSLPVARLRVVQGNVANGRA